MADRIDIVLDDDNDLKILDGDLATGAADAHHVEVILVSVPGAFKEYPLIGANIRSLVNGILDVAARRDLKVQLAGDGYKAKNISIDSDGSLLIEI